MNEHLDWWTDDKYWPLKGKAIKPDFPAIVAEAERRGREKGVDECIDAVHAFLPDCDMDREITHWVMSTLESLKKEEK